LTIPTAVRLSQKLHGNFRMPPPRRFSFCPFQVQHGPTWSQSTSSLTPFLKPCSISRNCVVVKKWVVPNTALVMMAEVHFTCSSTDRIDIAWS
jgi:hypothetical protein